MLSLPVCFDLKNPTRILLHVLQKRTDRKKYHFESNKFQPSSCSERVPHIITYVFYSWLSFMWNFILKIRNGFLSHGPQKRADSTKDNFVSNEFHPPHVLCNKFFHSKSLQMFFLTGSDVFFSHFSNKILVQNDLGSNKFWVKKLLSMKIFW